MKNSDTLLDTKKKKNKNKKQGGDSVVTADIETSQESCADPVPDGPTDVPTDGPTDGETEGPTDGPTDVPTDGPIDGPTGGPTDESADGPTDGPADGPTDVPTDGAIDGPTDGATDGLEQNQRGTIDENNYMKQYSNEKLHYNRLLTLLNGIGRDTLRKCFVEIHPTWSNQPSDISTLDLGMLNPSKLANPEKLKFNSGNIMDWDSSLLIKVLLHTTKCKNAIAKDWSKETHLRQILFLRNTVVGHASSENIFQKEFNKSWLDAKTALVYLGADEKAIDRIIAEDAHSAASYYKDLLEEEQQDRSYNIPKTVIKPPVQASRHSAWDEWIKFCKSINDFDSNENQYILFSDYYSENDLTQLAILRKIEWKMVMDIDPESEEFGFYQKFTSEEGGTRKVCMWTPDMIGKLKPANLSIDSHKTHWLFVRGRSNDLPVHQPASFENWEMQSVKQISKFLLCAESELCDKHKPVICFLLPFRKVSAPFVEATLKCLCDNFSDFADLKLVTLNHDNSDNVVTKMPRIDYNLDIKTLHDGLENLFHVDGTEQQYWIPSSHAKVLARITHDRVLYLQEYLDILFKGCQIIPNTSDLDPDENELLQIECERKSFISGNWISFISLFDNHDAKRQIETEVQLHIQSMLDTCLTQSVIVDLVHSPGTGGSTIARRILWNLHTKFPCAFLKVSSHSEIEEENTFVANICDRISKFEEYCSTCPIILVDGTHSQIEAITIKVLRTLRARGKRALLLRCRWGKQMKKKSNTTDTNEVHETFHVNVHLEESPADYREFKRKYAEYFKDIGKVESSKVLCRVYHFPLIAMVEEFKPKLKEIVFNSLKEMVPVEQDIVLVVAFLQLYAARATPAVFLYQSFKAYFLGHGLQSVTYKYIKKVFSEHFLNLMVQEEPRRQHKTSYFETTPEYYTLQHRQIAHFVMEMMKTEQNRTLFRVAEWFLKFPIFDTKELYPLFADLFLFNKNGETLKFSYLIDELKKEDANRAGKILEEAAGNTKDPIIFTHAARFYAKMTIPNFEEAKAMIDKAFHADVMKHKSHNIFDTLGVVLSAKLRYMTEKHLVKDLSVLENLAKEAVTAFRKARNFAPNLPNPLIGEVSVFTNCLQWIIADCDGDAQKALKFVTAYAPDIFRGCISHSFYLLNLTDEMAQREQGLKNPEETKRLSQELRVSLMKTFQGRSSILVPHANEDDLVLICQEICSTNNFPKSSQLELDRLQIRFMLNKRDKIENFKQTDISYIISLLEKLIFKEQEYDWCSQLLKVCVLKAEPSYPLEKGLKVTEHWSYGTKYDCYPHFYEMIVYFIKILDGEILQCAGRYHKALKLCREKSQGHCRRFLMTHFLSRDGEGMSRIMSRNSLLRGESGYDREDPEKIASFWQSDSRTKLYECTGRLHLNTNSRNKELYIKMLSNVVDVYVGKSAEIGKADIDFTPGCLVRFVVGFNLKGPSANGIKVVKS